MALSKVGVVYFSKEITVNPTGFNDRAVGKGFIITSSSATMRKRSDEAVHKEILCLCFIMTKGKALGIDKEGKTKGFTMAKGILKLSTSLF
ncbi:hypothetical protein HEBU111660_06190 [Helicobacter burdigaliensis]